LHKLIVEATNVRRRAGLNGQGRAPCWLPAAAFR
jgi:hypothetical protein